jgi:hypothetical protein
MMLKMVADPNTDVCVIWGLDLSIELDTRAIADSICVLFLTEQRKSIRKGRSRKVRFLPFKVQKKGTESYVEGTSGLCFV